MKPWIHEEILKTWTDAQKRLWESLCSAVPFQPPAGVEAWRETYLKNLASWESAVKRTLEKEAAWVEEWVQRVAREKGTPEMMASWVRQMEEVLHRWIQTQNQWWDDYFAVLRRGGFAQPDQFDTQPAIVAETLAFAAKPAVTIEPTAVEKLPATAESSPAALESEIAWAEVAPDPIATPTAPKPLLECPPELVPVVASVARQPDDLKLINGVGPALERKLNACGVLSFRDLATLGEADIGRIETAIKFAGRIHREDWIGQAKAQHLQKYQEQL